MYMKNVETLDSGLELRTSGLMDRALDLKPKVVGCGLHDCSPGATAMAGHCSKCVHLDGLNAENIFHCSLYSV